MSLSHQPNFIRLSLNEESHKMMEIAITIADNAAEIALRWFENRSELSVETKGHHDWVSQADREVEQYIRRELHRVYPEHHFFGEELGGDLTAPCWVIDPIDGTTNFLYGHGDFAVSLAFMDQDGARIGIIANPIQKRVIVASRGDGAYEIKNGEWKHLVPRVHAGNELVIGLNLNYKPGVTEGYIRNTRWLIEHGHQVRVSGSAAWTMTQVACGELDGCYMGHVYIWDVMAAQLICAEAGLEVAPELTATCSGPIWAWPKSSILECLTHTAHRE
ncbi:inositol monophosphatase [Vibrio atlanticus]|nr:inositol monophosphatase [Vibrio atlanticus]